MIFSCLLLFASLSAVELHTADGATVSGTLVSLSESKAVVLADGAEQPFEADQLQNIQFPEAALLDAEAFVGLHDGTIIGFEQLEMAEGGSGVRVTHRIAGPLELAVEDIHWIRFQPRRAATNARWQELVEQERPSDLLVIRRPNNVLDRINGIVLGIEQSQVLFDLDGERIAAPRDRLEGIVFREASGRPEAKQPAARLTDVSGSRWAVATMSLQPSDGSDAAVLQLETVGGKSLSLNLDQIVEISFASAAVALDRLTPISAKITPFHDLGLPAELTSALIGAQQVEEVAARSGKSATIVMTGRSSLEYRIPEGAQQLTARVVMPRPSGQPVHLRILLDGKESLSLPLDAQQPQHAVQLDISGARRLLLDYDGFSAAGIGDRILIQNARMSQ